MTRLRCAALALVLAGVLPSCNGTGTPTIPDVTNAVLSVTVDPTPVAGTQNPLTFQVSAAYKINIKETNGLGGEFQFVSASIYDPASGGQVALQYYDAADLTVFVGQKRIEPLGELVVSQTLNYTLPDYSKPANMVVTVQMKDDRANLIMRSLLVKIE